MHRQTAFSFYCSLSSSSIKPSVKADIEAHELKKSTPQISVKRKNAVNKYAVLQPYFNLFQGFKMVSGNSCAAARITKS